MGKPIDNVLRIYAYTDREGGHRSLGSYETGTTVPWVPRQGEFFRFNDPYPPGLPQDHREVAGTVKDVVTCFYGTFVVVEVYVMPRELEALER